MREAIRNSGKDIEVPGEETQWFGPFDSYADIYRIAEVKGFEELQELGLIPDGLSEQGVAEALAADETAYLEARKRAQAEGHYCGCQDPASRHAVTRNREPRHANLANMLRLTHPRSSAVDDPEVQHVYSHLRRWFGNLDDTLWGWPLPKHHYWREWHARDVPNNPRCPCKSDSIVIRQSTKIRERLGQCDLRNADGSHGVIDRAARGWPTLPGAFVASTTATRYNRHR